MWFFRAKPFLALLLCGAAVVPATPGAVKAQSVRSGRLFRLSEGLQSSEARFMTRLYERPVYADGRPFQGAPSQGRAFLSSLVLPGLGQYQQGRRRWALYAGVEIVAAVLYFDRRSDGRTFRTRYRDFAWNVGRSSFRADPRVDGDFRYFETLSKWGRSGAWDRDPMLPGLQPETDPSTFNGSIWALAVEIFDLDPADPAGSSGLQGALDYYSDRGYGPDFLWDWTAFPGAQETFSDLIDDSDRGFRQARQAVGVLLANHLLSAVDGLITARLAALPGLGTELNVQVPIGPF